MKKLLILCFITLLFLAGCKNVFFKPGFISSINFPKSDRNVTVYYDVDYYPDGPDKLIVKRHQLLHLGENPKTLPDVFYVYDGSVEKLKSFDVRIIHSDGATKSFGKSNCVRANLSNARIISGLSLYYLPVGDRLQTGDLVEIVSVHENTMPFLGIAFSPGAAGDLAYNVSCSIEMKHRDSLYYKIENDSISPEITILPDSKTYRFHWPVYEKPEKKNIFGNKNSSPGLLAQMAPGAAISSDISPMSGWKAFGDTYLDLIRFRLQPAKAEALAKEITSGKTSPREMMNAIAEYCQRNIRYEQVYIEKGEFIPNDFSGIISHRYGDCKDYSLAIYLLARSIGIKAHLALCYRGRGVRFYPDIAVSQFNHMIVYYSDNGKDYWYDGTNRSSTAGVIDLSLINQTALVLEKGNSRLVRISESPENVLSVSGRLQEKNKALLGDLTFTLKSQYAIDFLFLDSYLNEKDMGDHVYSWLRENIHKNIIVSQLTWDSQPNQFTIHASCELPNTVVSIPPSFYVSASRLLPGLFPASVKSIDKEDLFYFPFYARVKLDLELTNLSPDENTASHPFLLSCQYAISPGPISGSNRDQFIDDFKAVSEILNTNFKLSRRSIL